MVDILRLRNTPVSTVRAQLGDMAGVKVTSKGLCNMKQRARNTQLGGLTEVVPSIWTAAGFAGGACLALMLIFSCVAFFHCLHITKNFIRIIIEKPFIFHLFGGCLCRPLDQSYLPPLTSSSLSAAGLNSNLTSDMFMISTDQVTNKKSALDELHYYIIT